MSLSSIERIEQLELPNLTAADLKVRVLTGRAIDIGNGRGKKKLYRSGVQTAIGDIEISAWIQAAEYIVDRDGLKDELEHLRPFALYTPNADKSIRQMEYVRHLDMCLSELYRNPAWVHFVPYSRKYHPEFLDAVPVVRIITGCCKELCTIPEAQIKPEAKTAPCPICGRWSSFRYADPDGQKTLNRTEETT